MQTVCEHDEVEDHFGVVYPLGYTGQERDTSTGTGLSNIRAESLLRPSQTFLLPLTPPASQFKLLFPHPQDPQSLSQKDINEDNVEMKSRSFPCVVVTIDSTGLQEEEGRVIEARTGSWCNRGVEFPPTLSASLRRRMKSRAAPFDTSST